MKKIAIVAAAGLLAASSMAFANDMDMGTQAGGKFYVGADVGYVQAKVGDDDTVKPDGIRGGIFAGYGVKMDNYYLGGEAKFSYAHAREKDKLSGVDAEFEQKESFSVAFRPGYFVANNVLIYGNVGLVNTKFKDVLNYHGNSASPSKRLNGLQLGAGVQYTISDQFAVRGEYVHDFYEDWLSADYASDEVNVGLVWNIG